MKIIDDFHFFIYQVPFPLPIKENSDISIFISDFTFYFISLNSNILFNFDQKAKATGSHNKILCVVECRPNRHQLFCLPAAADPFISDQRSLLLTLLLPPHPLLHLGLCRLVFLFSTPSVKQGCSNNPLHCSHHT